MGLEAADVGDEVVDFLPGERKTTHPAVGFGKEGCEPVVGPAIVAADSRQRRGRAPRPTAVDEMALGAPAASDILARNGSPAAWTEPFAITKAPLNAIIAQTLSRGRHMIVRV